MLEKKRKNKGLVCFRYYFELTFMGFVVTIDF